MGRKKLKYEWDHVKAEFSGPTMENEPNGLNQAVSLIIEDITTSSGIKWKPPVLFVLFVMLICICGYTASFISITNQKYGLGMIFLICTPILAFCCIVIKSLQPNRYSRILSYLRVKSIDYQSISRKEGYHFDYLVVDSNLF